MPPKSCCAPARLQHVSSCLAALRQLVLVAETTEEATSEEHEARGCWQEEDRPRRGRACHSRKDGPRAERIERFWLLNHRLVVEATHLCRVCVRACARV